MRSLRATLVLAILWPAASTAGELITLDGLVNPHEVVAMGDVDGDGRDDLAVLWSEALAGGQYEAELRVLRGGYQAPVQPLGTANLMGPGSRMHFLVAAGAFLPTTTDGLLVFRWKEAGDPALLLDPVAHGDSVVALIEPAPGHWFDWAMGGLDFDGDGFEDLLSIQSYLGKNGKDLWLHFGGAGGGGAPDLQLLPPEFYSGEENIAVGDFDADGLADVVVAVSDGFALFRGAVGHSGTPDNIFRYGPPSSFHVIRSLTNVGDVTGDGVDDLVVLRAVSGGLQFRLLHGGPGFDGQPEQEIDVAGWFGTTMLGLHPDVWVHAAGDMDGDGFGDILLFHASRACLLRGGDPADPQIDAIFPGTGSWRGWERGFSTLDWDGDGSSEVLIDVHPRNSIYELPALLDEPFFDCNNNDIPDLDEVASGALVDCDADGIPDCAITSTYPQTDCDGDWALDSCQIRDNPGADCDGSGRLDSCELQEDPAARDCDSNGQVDSCEIVEFAFLDCNWNGTVDACESPDCEQPWRAVVGSPGDPDDHQWSVTAPGNHQVSFFLQFDPQPGPVSIEEVQFALDLPPGAFAWQTQPAAGAEELVPGHDQWALYFAPPLVVPAEGGTVELGSATVYFGQTGLDQRVGLAGCTAWGCGAGVPRMQWWGDTGPGQPVRHTQVAWVNASGPDCQRNGMLDAMEISRGHAADTNSDGMPDECEQATAVAGGTPRAATLHAPVPNPFNPRTTLSFTLAEAGGVELSLYDLAGRRVRTLLRGQRPAGQHDLGWDGTDGSGRAVGSGVYLLRLRTGGEQQSRRLVLLR